MRFGFPRAWTVDAAIASFEAAVAEITAASPALRARPPRVRPNGFRAEGYALDAGHDLVESLVLAHRRAHGEPPVSYALGSTTDARFYLNQFAVPAVCYGPRAVDIHGIDEHVELQSIVDGAKTLARFIVDYFGRRAR